MYRHILVPTDGSPLSTRAVKEAIELAKTCGAKLTAVHVIPPFTPPVYMDGVIPYPELYSPAEYKRVTEAQSQRVLAKITERARTAGVRCATAMVTAQPVWKAILSAARSKRCDAIVMASHGRRGIEGVLLGSETHKVLTHTKLPVVVCH